MGVAVVLEPVVFAPVVGVPVVVLSEGVVFPQETRASITNQNTSKRETCFFIIFLQM